MIRERYIDIVKGISILCIVLLHYEKKISPSEVEIFIGSFMISSFYVTSGWVSAMRSRKLTFRELLKKRWRQLGVPYLWWTIIILCFDMILFVVGYYNILFIGQEFYKSITFRGIGTLWFLPALFGGEIIWFFLRRKKVHYRIFALILSMIYLHIYHTIFDGHSEVIYRIIDAPFRTIANITLAWISIGFGYSCYNKFSTQINQGKPLYIFLMGILLFVFAFMTANYLPVEITFLWPLFAPLVGPLALLLMMKPIQRYQCFNYFEYWGINSLVLMVTHYSIVLVLFQIIVGKYLELSFTGWITIICFLISMVIQWAIVIGINKYARFTLGKTE